MKNRLQEVIVSVTRRCNSRCRMCDIPVSGEPELSTDQIKRLIQEVSLFHPRSFVFSGGEPLLRDDIFELVAEGRKYSFITCLTSNGRSIDRAAASRLKEAGMSVVNISIEGPEEVHDYLRGPGSFNDAVRALKHLADAGIETTIATCVSRYNYGHLPFIIGLARQTKATTVKFQGFNDLFLQDKERRQEFLISSDEVDRVRESVRQAVLLAQHYRIATNPVRYLELLPSYLSGQLRPPVRRGCSSLVTSCPIDSEGHVYPCWNFTDRAIGSIREKSILDIWESRRHRALRRRITDAGCPVCFMSCYDEHFDDPGGRPPLKNRLFYLKKAGFAFVFKRKWLKVARSIKRAAYSLKTSRKKSGQNRIRAEMASLKAAKALLEKKMRSL